MALPFGRHLCLGALRQYLTYEDVLIGLPNAERNKWQLDALVAEERARPYHTPAVHLIQPHERPIECLQGEQYPSGPPAMLPAVTCIGRSRSLDRVRDLDYSELVVIWCQEDFAFPIDPAVFSQLLALDWDALAADFLY